MILKEKIKFVLRIVIGFIILILLSRSINFSESFRLIFNASVIWLIFAFTIIVSLRFILPLRWKIILDYQKIIIPFNKLVKINYIGTSLGQVLPGGVGSDVVRGYELNKEVKQAVDITSSIMFDRIVGMFSMIFIAYIVSQISDVFYFSLGISNYLLILIIVIIVSWLISPKIKKFLLSNVKFSSENLSRKFRKILIIIDSITDKNKIKKLFTKIFSISLLVQIVRSFMFYFIFSSLGISVDIIYFLIFIPLMLVITILPISFGGLGVREGTLVYFFSLINIKPEICVSAGLIFQILTILFSLPGILIWIWESKNKMSYKSI